MLRRKILLYKYLIYSFIDKLNSVSPTQSGIFLSVLTAARWSRRFLFLARWALSRRLSNAKRGRRVAFREGGFFRNETNETTAAATRALPKTPSTRIINTAATADFRATLACGDLLRVLMNGIVAYFMHLT